MSDSSRSRSQFTARPTVYKGVKMRSRLEAGFAQWLDQWKFDWEYEPCAFGSGKGQYLPDFKLNGLRCSWRDQPTTAYVEVKPKNWPYWNERDDDVDEHAKLMRSMAIIWDSEPDTALLLVQPNDPILKTADGFHACDVGLLDLGWSPDDVDPYPWPALALWAKGPNDTVGLAKMLPHKNGPWPDGYWKVGH